MTRSANELVTEFCEKWSTPDPEELAGYFTEDAVYHNIPMRTDVMRRKGGEPIPLPVTGVFEIENGQIKAWRDYFDMATITSQFG